MEDAFQYIEMVTADEDRLLSILIESENESKPLFKEGLNIEEKITQIVHEMDHYV